MNPLASVTGGYHHCAPTSFAAAVNVEVHRVKGDLITSASSAAGHETVTMARHIQADT